MMRFPATPEKSTVEGDIILDYGYHLITPDQGWFDNKELRIFLDANGIVKDIVFEASKRNSKNDGDTSVPGL